MEEWSYERTELLRSGRVETLWRMCGRMEILWKRYRDIEEVWMYGNTEQCNVKVWKYGGIDGDMEAHMEVWICMEICRYGGMGMCGYGSVYVCMEVREMEVEKYPGMQA